MQNGNNTAAAESTVYPTTEANDPDDAITPAKTRLSAWLLRTSLPDLIDTRHHSRDFNGSRAEYIYRRMRLLALVFAGLAPLWIPVDMVLLNGARFQQMLMLRLSFSAALVLLALWTGRPHNLTLARLRVALFIAIPGLFYIGSRLVLNDRVPEVGVLMGYSFLPYLIVSLLAVFPFTVLEGVAYTAAIGAIVAVTQNHLRPPLCDRRLREMWALWLVAGLPTAGGAGRLVRVPSGQSIGFPVGIGVAMLQSAEGAEALLQRVDKGLYRAKEAGRDLAVTA